LRIARFHANPARTTTGNPLQPRLDGTGLFTADSVVFNPDALRGCIALETLDVSNAWNVYFARGVLAEIGAELELHLFDDGGTSVGGKSYGHPQIEAFLGVLDIENADSELYGRVSLTSIKIFAPIVTSGTTQIEKTYDAQPGETGEFVAIHTGIVPMSRGRVPNITVERVPLPYPYP